MTRSGKMIFGSSTSLAALLISASAAQAETAAPVQATAASSANAGHADDSGQTANTADIVVTASKRDEKLRDVPSAITVLTSATLDTQGVQSIRDYATLTPGLGERDFGRPGIGTIFIRGLTTGAGQQSATSVVYMDDVAFTSSSYGSASSYVAPEPELADVDRIEVLKGPQGTLYGASSLGGVVRIITKRPDATTFSGNARAEGTSIDGGGYGYLFRGSVNIPLVTDQLAIRATAFYRRTPGFIDNVSTGEKNENDGIAKGGRLALGWTPTDRLSVDLVGQIQNTDSDGIAYQSNISGTLTPIYGEREYNSFFKPESSVHSRLGSATIKYNTDLGNIIATGSYLDSDTSFGSDATSFYGGYLPLFGYPAGTGIALLTNNHLKKETAEVRFVSNRLGPVEFVVGGFYTHERTDAIVDGVAEDIATKSLLASPFNNFVTFLSSDEYREVAAFGNATLYIANNFDITGGIRFAHNSDHNSQQFSGALEGFATLPQLNFSSRDDVLTYLATMRWRPTKTLSVFLRAASGYRPGGPQTNPSPPVGAQTSIRPDTVWNYEAGIKGDFIDHTLSLEASVYHIDWKDVQLSSTFGGLSLQANAGKAQVDGFEFQAVAKPTRLLNFGWNLAYTNARIANISPGATASTGASKGDPLPLTPKWTTSVTVDQRIPLSETVEGMFGATVRMQSAMFNSYPGNLMDLNVKLPEITTLDLRAGLKYQAYQLFFRARNVFDRNGVTNLTTSNLFPGQGVPSTATVIQPRSFTLGISVDF